jgi:hypothetical protein
MSMADRDGMTFFACLRTVGDNEPGTTMFQVFNKDRHVSSDVFQCDPLCHEIDLDLKKYGWRRVSIA